MSINGFTIFFSRKYSYTVYFRWNFGYRICDLYNSLDVHFSTVSTLHLCCIAIDRYYAIVRPLKYSTNMTVHVAAAMIGIAWTAPTLISFLPIFLGWYTTNEHLKWRKDHPDICLLKANVPYALLSSTLTFWLPVSVMLIMYHRVYKEAQRQKVRINCNYVFVPTLANYDSRFINVITTTHTYYILYIFVILIKLLIQLCDNE